jgi:hypothetical protein
VPSTLRDRYDRIDRRRERATGHRDQEFAFEDDEYVVLEMVYVRRRPSTRRDYRLQ